MERVMDRHLGNDDDDTIRKLQSEGKWKPKAAVAALGVALLTFLGITYMAYRDVPAAANPANAAPPVVEPYR